MDAVLADSQIAGTGPSSGADEAATTSWRHGLPVLCGSLVNLRELTPGDALSLVALLTPPEVSRFIASPPTTVEAFERFIASGVRLRMAGMAACFAVTPRGLDTAIGLFQVRELEAGFRTAEWGFALGSPFWGTGVFQESAALVLDFVFGQVGAHRVEARSSVRNGRGARALEKLGAVQEGVLRRAARRDGEYFDQALYAIVADDWQRARRALPHIH